MKTILAFLSCVILQLKILANPLVFEPVNVQEIFIHEEGYFEIEFYFAEWDMELLKPLIDSITVHTSIIEEKIGTNGVGFKDPFKKGSYYIGEVDTLDRLCVVMVDPGIQRPFINREGDFLTIKGYYEGVNVYTTTITFGNLENAEIGMPLHGHSICRSSLNSDGYYYKDSSPTIGTPNDKEGAYCTWKGTLYNKNSIPVGGENFCLYYYYNEFDFPINVYFHDTLKCDENGNFEIELPTKSHNYRYVFCVHAAIGNMGYEIEPISFTLDPDSTIVQDIHLLKDYTDIQNVFRPANHSLVEFYPNPVLIQNNQINYRTLLPVNAMEFRLNIRDLSGRLVDTYIIKNSEGVITLPASCTPGHYFLHGYVDEEMIVNQKIIIQ